MSNYEGYYVRATVVKRKSTGVYEKVYILRDMSIGCRVVGVFDADYKVDRYWDNVYIPSKRAELQTGAEDIYDISIADLPIHYDGGI